MGRAFAYVLLGVLLSGFGLVLLRGSEDAWICTNGAWIKHGNPSASRPIVPCHKKGIAMKLTSPAFADNGELPDRYSCDGDGVSPLLSIIDVSPLAKSLALTVDDPDAPNGTFHHWLVWNIDPKTKIISENSFPTGAVVGTNSAGNIQFAAICPPNGTHRYVFTLYALDDTLNIDAIARWPEFDAAMSGHVLTQSILTGKYTKK